MAAAVAVAVAVAVGVAAAAAAGAVVAVTRATAHSDSHGTWANTAGHMVIVVVNSASVCHVDCSHRSSAAISGVIGTIALLLPFWTLQMQAGDFIVIGQ